MIRHRLLAHGGKISIMEQKNNNYELSFWLSPKLSEKELEQKFNGLLKELETLGGIITFSQLPQLKPLAYPLKKEKNTYYNAYFGYIQFRLLKDSLIQLKEKLRLNKDIIRFLIITIEAKKKSHISPDVFKKSSFKKQEAKKEEKQKKIEQEGVSLEELDKKLSEILKD